MLKLPDLRRVEKVAQDLLTSEQWNTMPVDPVAIAEQLGIVVRASTKLGGAFSGCLVHDDGNFAILYSTSIPNEGYQRFTVSHELGHHQLVSHHASLFANGSKHLSAGNFVSPLQHEIEADHFAAELLMPRMHFQKEIGLYEIGIPAVKGLSSTFNTSLTSTAIRYAQLTPDPVAVIVSQGQQVLYCFTSDCLSEIRGVFIRKGSSVPLGSATSKFNAMPEKVLTADSVEGTTCLSAWFENSSSELKFFEDVIGMGRYGRTLTILHTTTIPDVDDLGEDFDYFNPDGKRYRW